MKSNGKIVYLGIVVLSVVLIASIALAFSISIGNPNNAYAEIINSTIADSYNVGDNLVIPQNAIIRYEGERYDGNFASLIRPDGSGSQSRVHLLEEVGVYQVTYEFVVGTQTKQACKTFSVKRDNWQVTSEESTVEFTDIQTHADTQGLFLSLARGDSFTFSQPIRLNETGATELITFFPEQFKQLRSYLPTEQRHLAGDYEVQRIIVTLTDCYNPDIYVDMILYFDLNPLNGCNARTRSVQGEFGLVSDGGAITTHGLPTVSIDGRTYGYWKGQWGSGVASGVDSAVTNATWTFDQETMQVRLVTATPDKERLSILVGDLDNTDISPSKFPGFTTGDVYLTISANDYIKGSATMQIESIGGVSGEDLKQEKFIDSVSPIVVAQRGDATGEVFAQTGMEFPLFDAIAYDGNLVGGVSSKVFYNYGTPMQSAVLVRDGKFIPEQVGIYTIEYTARDSFGNVGKTTVPITVIDTPVVLFETTQITSATAGVAISLPEFSASSKNGEVKVTISATTPNGQVTEIDPNKGLFTLINVGKHTITYIYGDKIRSYEYKYELNVSANSSNGFIEMPSLEEFYIKGISYHIDDITAYTFGGAEPSPVDTTAYVRFDDGSYQKVSDLTNVLITGSNTVQFKYVAGSAELETKAIPITDVGYDATLEMHKYFQGNFTADPQYSYIDFTSNVDVGSNQLTFGNKVISKLFSVKYALPNKLNQFSTFDIALTDDAGDRLVISLKNANGSLVATVSGKDIVLPGTINDGTERTIAYDADAKTLVFSDNNDTVTVPFEMPIGDQCKLSFTFTGLTGKATLRVINILNQLICADGYDYYGPQIYMTPSKGYAEVNTVSVANAALAGDVLSPIKDCEFTLSVVAPDGSFAVDENGLKLENVSAKLSYNFILEQFGDYTVEYYVKDATGKVTFNAYVVTSADVTAPTITFKDKKVDSNYVQEMKVGYKYKIKEFVVEDNDTPANELETHIFVYNTNGQLLFAEVTEITPTYEGRYIVYIYCLDSAGNSSYVMYQINVIAESK